MNNFLRIFVILTAFHCIKTDKELVPVFLIDYSRILDHLVIEQNPFTKISTPLFADIVYEAIRKSEIVIIFMEDQFSVEDISFKDKKGTSYYHLHLGLLDCKVKYLPKVIQPYKLFTQKLPPQPFNVFYLSDASDPNLRRIDGQLKYFYVFFRDGKNETRAETMRRHDLIMKEVYSSVKNLGKKPVVAFYTGKLNPVEVDKFDFVPVVPLATNKYPGVVVASDSALFQFKGVFSATNTRRASFNQVPVVAEETWTLETLTTKMAYTGFELEFDFSFKDDYWTLDSVGLLEGGEEVGRTAMSVGAQLDCAYYCGEPLTLVNTRDGSSVIVSEYRIQPLNHLRRRMKTKKKTRKARYAPLGNKSLSVRLDDAPEETPEEPAPATEEPQAGSNAESEEVKDSAGFGKTVHCGPYFSAGILTGLLIVSFFLGILSFGVISLMNCKSNDRYEDVHGKPLVLGSER